jgi:hypothetical protein
MEINEIPAMDSAAYSIASPAVGPTAGPDAEPGGQPQCNGAGVDIAIDVAGDGFLYNMVRIITGTLVEVGAGKLPADSISGIIGGCDRRKAGHTAPPQGLYLVEVYY